MMKNGAFQQNKIIQIAALAFLVIAVFIGSYAASSLIAGSTSAPAPASDSSPSTGGAAIVSPPFQLHDFTLTSQTGSPIRLSDLRGEPVALMFGYTHCPDVCPTTLAEFKQVKSQLGEAGEDVHFVFISVDGRRDTPEVVADFLGRFDTDFIGMTGDEDTLRQIGNDYGLVFSTEGITVANESEQHQHGEGDHLDSENYFVTHTSPSFLIDRNGYLRTVYFYGASATSMAASLQQLLAEEA